MHPGSLFSLAEHLERLCKDGDPLEVLAGTVEFGRFRPVLVRGLGYSDGAKGGRPPIDPGSVELDALLRLRPWRSNARREHHPP